MKGIKKLYRKFEDLMNRISFGFALTIIVFWVLTLFVGLIWLAIWGLGWWSLLAFPIIVFAYLIGTFTIGADGDVDKFKEIVKKDFPFLYRNDLSL